MAVKPTVKNLNADSVEIMNAIRSDASAMYKQAVPIAYVGDVSSIRAIGSALETFPVLKNEFLSALVNRIARVIVTSKLYSNPWSRFKKGYIENGESIEEIFVNIAKPFQFDQPQSETTVWKREIPDVKSAFHVMNYQKYYKATISDDQLRQAFLTMEGVSDLIARIVDSMYTGANYDEYQTMKYMIASAVLDGRLTPVTVPAASAANAKSIVSVVKGASNTLEFMSDKYNQAGVQTYTRKENQYIIIDTRFDAIMDVEVLASAFNMSKAEFMGHRVLIDGFGTLDTARLGKLFKGDSTYEEISQDDLTKLDAIPAVLVDGDFFMIFDNLQKFTELYNGEGLYWNYWLHVWKTFSISPFANCMSFVTGTPSVKSVSVSPSDTTLAKGASLQLAANVVTEYFAPKAVTWTSSSENTTVDSTGFVTVGSDETSSVTITATSKFNTDKTGTCTINISE